MVEGYVGPSKSSSRHKRRQNEENIMREERKSKDLELDLSLRAGFNGTGVVGMSKGKEVLSRCATLTAKGSTEQRGLSRASSSSSTSSVADSDVLGSAKSPSQAAGWPPIGNFRISSLTTQSKDNSSTKNVENKKNLNLSNDKVELISSKNQKCIDENSISVSSPNFTRLVKVNMDGDPIGRKVDLNSHQSYESLALSLEEMFHMPTTCSLTSLDYSLKVSKLLDSSSEFVLTYKDKDGDWLLVGDVPWEIFLDSVKRLKIMRNSGASGLAPGFQSLN